MKPEVRIRNWSTSAYVGPYQAPETVAMRLCGRVVDHPDIPEGHRISSSKVVKLDLKGRVVETLNTVYVLEGPPDPDWLEYLKSINYDLNRLPD